MIAAFEDEVATKTELSEFRNEVKADFAQFRSEVAAEFADVRTEMRTGFASIRAEMSALKSDLVFKLGALFVGFNTFSFGLFGVFLTYLHKS